MSDDFLKSMIGAGLIAWIAFSLNNQPIPSGVGFVAARVGVLVLVVKRFGRGFVEGVVESIESGNDAASTPTEKSGVRECPWCAEDIRTVAIVCRHCHRDVPPVSITEANDNDREDL